MSSYFDEHNCEPLRDGEAPDQLLHLVRLLIDTGNWDHQEFASLFNDRPPPPTSKVFIFNIPVTVRFDHYKRPKILQAFISKLPSRLVRDEEEKDCPVCLKKFDQDDEVNI